ncbi:MAG: hypothetical protein ACLPVY_04955 [Acidimicrobiia bacterium]
MTEGGRVEFTLDELVAIIEGIMRVADELLGVGDEVNAFLLDQVANQLLTARSELTDFGDHGDANILSHATVTDLQQRFAEFSRTKRRLEPSGSSGPELTHGA